MTRRNFFLIFITGLISSFFLIKKKSNDITEYHKNIGKGVAKFKSNKPFKSKLKINTVKDVINHPKLNVPAYSFLEDESYVECRRCDVVL